MHFSSKMKPFRNEERHFVKHIQISFFLVYAKLKLLRAGWVIFTNDEQRKQNENEGARFPSGQTFPWSSGPLVVH